MIAEIGYLLALPGKEAAFREALREAHSVISRAAGYRGSVFFQSIEESRKFCLVVWWASVEAHMKTFREGPLFPEWRKILNPLMEVEAIKPGVSFGHYTIIAGNGGL